MMLPKEEILDANLRKLVPVADILNVRIAETNDLTRTMIALHRACDDDRFFLRCCMEAKQHHAKVEKIIQNEALAKKLVIATRAEATAFGSVATDILDGSTVRLIREFADRYRHTFTEAEIDSEQRQIVQEWSDLLREKAKNFQIDEKAEETRAMREQLQERSDAIINGSLADILAEYRQDTDNEPLKEPLVAFVAKRR